MMKTIALLDSNFAAKLGKTLSVVIVGIVLSHSIVEQSGGGGNFHSGEVDPNHDILAHAVRDVAPNIIRNWFVPH